MGEADVIEINTPVQVDFHLNNNETLMFKIDKGFAFLVKENGTLFFRIQKRFGSVLEYVVSEDFDGFINYILEKTPMYVIKGGKFETNELRLIDKIADFFRGSKK